MLLPRLFSFELAWAEAAYVAIYPDPPRNPLSRGIRVMEPARFYDELIAGVPTEQALGLRVSLWIVALAPLFVLRRLCTIAALSEAERVTVLERLLASSVYAVRQLTLGFKAMGALRYAQDHALRAEMTTPRLAPAPEDSGPVLKEPEGAVHLRVLDRTKLMASSSGQTRAANEVGPDHAAAEGASDV